MSYTSTQRLFDKNLQHGFFRTVAVNEQLDRQGALVAARRCDDGFPDVHVTFSVLRQPSWSPPAMGGHKEEKHRKAARRTAGCIATAHLAASL